MAVQRPRPVCARAFLWEGRKRRLEVFPQLGGMWGKGLSFQVSGVGGGWRQNPAVVLALGTSLCVTPGPRGKGAGMGWEPRL